MSPTCRYPLDLFDRYEFRSYGHAMEILADAFSKEWNEIESALKKFTITTNELRKAGGNETAIPKKFDSVLYPLKEISIKRWIDGHNIDFIKNRVAFDLEWNSKDHGGNEGVSRRYRSAPFQSEETLLCPGRAGWREVRRLCNQENGGDIGRCFP